MSVLIKRMKMPENCRECPLETDYGTCGYYSLFVEGGHDSDWEKRRDDCPLIELPDLGDLIDRDELKHGLCVDCKLYPDNCLKEDCDWDAIYHIDHAPVVIPAEREEEDE